MKEPWRCAPGNQPFVPVGRNKAENESLHLISVGNRELVVHLVRDVHRSGGGEAKLRLGIHSKLSDAERVMRTVASWDGPATWVALADTSDWSLLRLKHVLTSHPTAARHVDVHMVRAGWAEHTELYPGAFLHEVVQSTSRAAWVLSLPSLSRPDQTHGVAEQALLQALPAQEKSSLAGANRASDHKQMFAVGHRISEGAPAIQGVAEAPQACLDNASILSQLPLIARTGWRLPDSRHVPPHSWRTSWVERMLESKAAVRPLAGVSVLSDAALMSRQLQVVWGAQLLPKHAACLLSSTENKPQVSDGVSLSASPVGPLPLTPHAGEEALAPSEAEQKVRLALGQGVTLVTMTYKRPKLVARMVQRYCSLAEVLGVLIISNDVDSPPLPVTAFPECPAWKPITSIVAERNAWKNRFSPQYLLQGVRTSSIMLMDDDMLFAAEAVRDAVWSHLASPQRHLGFIARAGVQDEAQQWTYFHGSVHKEQKAFNFALVGASLFHVHYAVQYASHYDELWEYVDRVFQCDDIGFAFVVAAESGHASMWLDAPYRRISPDSSGQFTKPGAMTTRSQCLADMSKLMGQESPGLLTNTVVLKSTGGAYPRPPP